MQNIKDFLNFLDYTVATFWGYTIIDIAPLIVSGGVFDSIDKLIKLAFALVGLFYTLLRAYHFYHNSKLDREIKKEELKKMKNY